MLNQYRLLVCKDLLCELRAWRVWPVMTLTGLSVAAVFGLHLDLLPDQKSRIVGGLLWLTVFLSGMAAMAHSFVGEREDGCWDVLLHMTADRGTLFLAKLTVNMLGLFAVQFVQVPVFFALSDLRLESCLATLVLVSVLATPALAAIGTLVGSLTDATNRGEQLLQMVSLPYAIPIILAAAETTRLAIQGPLDVAGWRWVQLLGGAALILVTTGWVLFEHAIEN